MKVFQWSDIDQLLVSKKDCVVDSDYFYYQVHLLHRIPEEELEGYQNLVHNVNLDKEETSERCVMYKLVTKYFRYVDGIRPLLCKKYTYSCRKKRV